jgi:glycosyltransferase involved in cell wall biosynthesis
MKSPSVSVITNSYNCASYLGANVKSVLGQDYEHWQHIVVDAGSTDGSLAILEELQHPRLKLLRVPHCGVSESRNIAIGQAEGDFVAILDADDVALPTRLRVQMQRFADDPRLGLVAGGITRVDQVTGACKNYTYPSDHDAIVALLRTGMNCLPHSTMIYRRTAFHQVGGYVTEKSEDFDLALRLARRGRLASVGDVVVRYAYRRPGAHTVAHRPKGRGGQFYVMLAVVLDAAANSGIAVSKPAIEAWLDSIGDDGLAALQGRWAARTLREAVRQRDAALLKQLSYVMAARMGSMARCRSQGWWGEAATPLAIAIRHTESTPKYR